MPINARANVVPLLGQPPMIIGLKFETYLNFFVNNKILMIGAIIDTDYLRLFANAYIALEVDHTQVEKICKMRKKCQMYE